jgi:CRP-like cAMP-binding protein
MTSISMGLNPMEEALAQLPKATAVEYRKGQVIYTGAQPSNRVYFLLQGQVAVSRLGSEGSPVVVGIYQTHDIFGEAALVNHTSRFEQAIALENSVLMSWPASDVVEAIVRQPHLGMALAKHLVERESELRWRIESFASDRILRRVARALIRLSDRLGTPDANGWVRMIPLTHKLISQYVGSTREIVTHHMTDFRKMGFVNYSRTGILVNRAALEAWLNEKSTVISGAAA